MFAAVPVSASESLVVYGLISEQPDFFTYLKIILSDYISSVTAKPRVAPQDIPTACEICDRDWIPLTDHHLIPRSVHAKVLKRGWHEEWELNNLARICGACHKYVHRIESNEQLAKEWYTVERLLGREDVQEWAKWVGKLRWKGR
jgi:5-methylcytosine-specific restriction endonuclease McrA